MDWIRRTLFALLICCCSSAQAQDASCLHRKIPFSVVDDTGAPIGNLAATDFHAEMHGKPMRVMSISNGEEPHRILILVDARGNMAGKTGSLWKTAMAIASQLAESKLPNTSLALFIFGERANQRVEFSQGNLAVAAKLHQIQTDQEYIKKHLWGMSAIRDAMVEGMKFFGTPVMGDEMFLITDEMGDNASKTSLKHLRNILEESGVRVFLCILSLNTGAELANADLIVLQALAENTGGEALVPADWDGSPKSPFSAEPHNYSIEGTTFRDGMNGFQGSALSRAVTVLYSEMVSAQRLEIALEGPVTKREGLKLELSREKKHELKDAVVAYAHQLAPCEAGHAH